MDVLSLSVHTEETIPEKVIYVFTQERLLAFLSNYSPKKIHYIDYVIADEAHQIGEKARGILLHQSLNWLKYNYNIGKFIFCSPVISNPQIFEQLLTKDSHFSSENFLTIISPVAQNLLIVEAVKNTKDELNISLYNNTDNGVELLDNFKSEEKRKDNSKFGFLAYCAFNLGKGKRNIIYVDGPSAADKVAEKLIELVKVEDTCEDIVELSNYIKSTIHKDFILARALKYKIGVHYGKVPSLIRDTVEKLFREERLDFIICTSTLAQGVNLPAQNLFLLDPKVKDSDTKKSISIPSPDFWNIVGRAGRLYKDFEGNVFLLKQPSKKENWENKFLGNDKLTEVVPAVQNVVAKERNELIEHLTDPLKNAKKGVEEAASFIFDIANSKQGIEEELAWIPGLEKQAVNELISSTKEAEQKIKLSGHIIQKNIGVSPVRQQELYDFLKSELILENWILPRDLSSTNEFHNVVTKIIGILDSPSMDTTTLKKYAWTFTIPAMSWIKGEPLNQMIKKHLDFEKSKNSNDDLTIKQINAGIRELFGSIENKVRFKLVKYINCYNNIFIEVCRERDEESLIEKTPIHLSLFLEVGASNNVQLDLISLGLSRITAIELATMINHSEYENSKELRLKIKKILDDQNDLPLACIDEIERRIS